MLSGYFPRSYSLTEVFRTSFIGFVLEGDTGVLIFKRNIKHKVEAVTSCGQYLGTFIIIFLIFSLCVFFVCLVCLFCFSRRN